MSPAAPLFAGVRLHVVTGKGGTGKTTVACALALAMARDGKRVLLAEVEGRQGISQAFDVPPLSNDEARILTDHSGGQLWGLSVDPKTALLEYLQIFYKLGRAGSILEKIGAIDFATTIAPGLRDVLLIGKVYEAVGRRVGGRRSGGDLVFDAVVLDAPPTGRVVRFLNVNAEVADVAKVGPIRQQADSITRMLRNPVTAVHVVTLLEEMPVQESIDAIADLRAADFNLGAIVVNEVQEPLIPDPQLVRLTNGRGAGLRGQVRVVLETAGARPTDAMVAGLFEEAAEHRQRVAVQREQEQVVSEQGLTVIRLPQLLDGIEDGGLRLIADGLAEQGLR